MKTFVTRGLAAIAGAAALVATVVPPLHAAEQNDNLNATLWMQTAVEFDGVALGAYQLAALMLDRALADKSWTAAPEEQTGDFAELPPAVILDVDETVLDNSGYQSWMVMNNESFHPGTWGDFVNTVSSVPVPGALEFTKYADSRGVKVFYVSNRTGDLEPATRSNLEKFGFPMGGNVDTVLLKNEIPEWSSSQKSPRRAHVAKDYRVLLVVGDNFGDFVDGYKGSLAERQALMGEHGQRWGRQWIVLPNPSYGSWESAPFGHDYKIPEAQRRKLKLDALSAWAR